MDWNREAVAAAVVGAGGAWMLGSALFSAKAQPMNIGQRRALALSGAGFLITAFAARWMQNFGRVGIACSLAGTVIAMIGMYQLQKERIALRESRLRDAAQRSASKPDSRD